MQFRKLLKKLIDDMLPDWRDQFLCYKVLKKQLKQIYSTNSGSNKRMKLTAGDEIDSVAADDKEVANFVKLCQEQIVKFNNFVLDKQEWYIIRIEVLEGKLVAAKDSNQEIELMKVGRDLVDLHGEIVLLLNYSALNYTGTNLYTFSTNSQASNSFGDQINLTRVSVSWVNFFQWVRFGRLSLNFPYHTRFSLFFSIVSILSGFI
ncbi:putative SPX domain-containing protein [Helianthus annuus]|nr:putative SPX domain-containing protein [Helianthus annuus]